MSSNLVLLPYSYWADTSRSRALSGGKIYIGEVDKDPETFPIDVFYIEENGTEVPALQPLEIGAGGIIMYNGKAVQIGVNSNYSMRVRNSSGGQIYNVPNNFATGGATKEFVISNIENLSGITFESVDKAKNGETLNGDIYDLTLLSEFTRLDWQGYYAQSDGGSNWGRLRFGAHTEDGGSIFSIDANTYIEANLVKSKISVLKFGAKGDGTTDDSAAIQKTATFLTNGGTLILPRKHVSLSSLIIPVGVTLSGTKRSDANPGDNTTADYSLLDGSLLLDSSAFISLASASGINNLLIYRNGMTFPERNSSSFAGTAAVVIGEDVFITNSMFLGFNQAIDANGRQRLKVANVSIDCQNGVKIENSLDIAYINKVHCWPFATISDPVKLPDWADRGNAFWFLNIGDWTKVTDCFSYGYSRGYTLDSVNSMTLTSCSADGTQAYAGSVGFNIINGCTDTRLIGCQAAAQDTGYRFDTDLIPGLPTEVIGCSSWGCITNGALIDGGDVRINGGIWRDTMNGIAVNSAVSNVFIDNARFSNLASIPINLFVATSNVRLGDNNDYGDLGVGGIAITQANHSITSISTANIVSIPADKGMFNLTGTTIVSLIGSGWTGRQITLIAQNGTTFVHGGNDPTVPSFRTLKLSGDVNAVLAAGGTITLRHDGTFWYEVARA